MEELEDKVEKISQKEDIRDKNETIMVPVQETQHQNNGSPRKRKLGKKKRKKRTSLVAQWLRICLPMQGTRVQVLVWEDPTCLGATKPVSHNY